MRKIFTLFIVLLLAAAGVASAGESSKKDADNIQQYGELYDVINVEYQPTTGNYFVCNQGDGTWYTSIIPIEITFKGDPGFVGIVRNRDLFHVDTLKVTNLFSPVNLKLIGDSLYILDGYKNRLFGVNLIDTTTFLQMDITDTTADIELRDMCTDTSGFLYITAFKENAIYRISLGNYTTTKLQLTGDSLMKPSCLIFEEELNRLLITSTRDSNSVIHALPLNTLELSTVMNTGLPKLVGLTKDPVNKKYYAGSYHPVKTYEWRKIVVEIDSSFTTIKQILEDKEDSYDDIYYNPLTEQLVCTNSERIYFIDFYQDKTTLLYPPDSAENLCNMPMFRVSSINQPSVKYKIFISTSRENFEDSLCLVTITTGDLIDGYPVDTVLYFDYMEDDSLISGKRYYWRAQAFGVQFYTAGPTEIRTFTTAPIPKPRPVIITPPNDTIGINTGIRLEWEAIPGVEYYLLELRQPTRYLYVYNNFYNFYEFDYDKTYYCRVRGCFDSTGGTDWSYFRNFSTGLPYLGTVELDSPRCYYPNASNNLKIKWHPLANAENYVVKYYALFSKDVKSFLVSASDTTAELTGLENGIIYEWSVKGVHQNGDGEFAESWTFYVVDTSAGIPDILPLENDYEYPEFVWDDIGASSYNLQVDYQRTDSSPYSTFESYIINKDSIEATKYKSTIALKKNTKYVWRVRGNYNGKYSYWSEPDPFTVTGANSVDDAITGEPMVSVIPNPVYDIAEIRLRGAGAIQAEVYNSIGELVTILPAEKSGNENSLYLWNTKNISSGLYFIRFNIDGKVFSKKVSVVK